MIKEKLHIIKKIICFILILIIGINITTNILKKPKNEQWEATGLENIWKNKNYYNVILCGPSMSITNISSEELYLQDGISSITIGAPFQPMYLSYYALKDALIVQKPTVVILDISSLFYSEETLKDLINTSEHHYLHYTLDQIHNLKIRYEAFEEAKNYDPKLNFWNYFSSLYYNHNNWQELSERNFMKTHGKDVMNGNLMLYEINNELKRTICPYDIINDGKCEAVYYKNEEYLEKIIQLCQQKGVNILLFNGKVDFQWNWEKYNTVKQISDKYELDYLDVNLFEDDAQINWKYDLSDDRHTNIIGAKKISKYLGKYLEKYTFNSRENSNESFELNKFRYESLLEIMQEKQDLLKSNSLKLFVQRLKSVEIDDNLVLIYIKGVEHRLKNLEIVKQLNILGVGAAEEYDTIKDYGKIISNNYNKEWINEEEQQRIIDVDGETRIEIQNGEKETNISIVGCDSISVSDGIRIIVYNKELKLISDSQFDFQGNRTN